MRILVASSYMSFTFIDLLSIFYNMGVLFKITSVFHSWYSSLLGIFNFHKFSQMMDVQYTSWFFYCAVFSIFGATLLTYFLNNWALKRAPSGNVAIFIYLQPVVAGVIGYFFLKEVITMRMVICSGLILTGLLFSISKSQKGTQKGT